MQTLGEIRRLLDERGLAPRRRLGQHFLIDHHHLRRLVDAAAVQLETVVLEVGAGTGALTEELLDRGYAVIANELDTGLVDLMHERLGGRPNLTLVPGDALASKRALAPELVRALADRPFALIANLPYAIATPLLVLLLVDYPQCSTLAVTVQHEVGERILAGPGCRAYGTLSVICQALAQPERIARLSPACFWPRPEVHSDMLVLRRRAEPLCHHPRRLADQCQRLFQRRRQQVGRIVGRARPLPPDIAPTARVEQLQVEQIVRLCEHLGEP